MRNRRVQAIRAGRPHAKPSWRHPLILKQPQFRRVTAATSLRQSRRHYTAPPVVTTRTMPQQSKSYR